MAGKLSAELAAGRVPAAKIAATKALIFNNCLDAVVAGIFLVLVVAVLAISLREWILILGRRKAAVLHECPPVWLPATVIASESQRRWWHLGHALILVGTLAKELSGEAAAARSKLPPAEALQETLATKYDNSSSPTRCC
jgi:hypothetical protein